MDPAHRGRLWGHPAHALVSVATQPLGEHAGALDSGWGGLLDATLMRRIEPYPGSLPDATSRHGKSALFRMA